MSVYVWGTGCGAGELIERGFEPARITAFVESVPESRSFLGRKVIAPEEIDASDCELIIVSTRYTKEVMELCRSLGIAVEKLFFLKNSCTLIDLNEKSVAPQVLGDELYSRLKPRHRLIKEPESLTGKTADSGDYIRLAQLELICGRLCHVPGAAAELGVFRGDFARHINRLLPERKLYLFDSFQGFEEKSGAGAAFQQAFFHTPLWGLKSVFVLCHWMWISMTLPLKGFVTSGLGSMRADICFCTTGEASGSAALQRLLKHTKRSRESPSPQYLCVI